MLIIVLRHVFNFISAILFIMHNNDVELRFPCQEGTMGKSSQLALVKIRKYMTKENRIKNLSFLKSVKSRQREKQESFRRKEKVSL